jgi:hypothetical protein
MRKGGGKQKGANTEREVCKKLSLWLSHGKHEDLLWRSAMSGGRSTVGFAKGKRLAAQAGDISSIHPLSGPFIEKFLCEVKDYRDLNFVGLLSGRGHLVQFWGETVVQARNYSKFPLLIAHQNRQPTIACFSILGLRHFTDLDDTVVLAAPKLDLWIVLFEDLLKHEHPW